MQLGPDEILVAARVDIADAETGRSVEDLADDVESAVRTAFDDVRHVFVDPTRSEGS